MTRPASRTAQSAGAALETLADHHHARARTDGIAHVRKVSPEVAIIRRNPDGSFIGRWRGKSGVDRRGTMRGGQSVIVEIKSTATGNLARSEFTTAEVADLDDCVRLGGLAIVLWQRRDANALYAIPWSSMPWRKSGRGQSVRAEDVREWFVIEMPYLKRFAEPAR